MPSKGAMLWSMLAVGAAAHDGVTVTYQGKEASGRQLQMEQMVKCANMTFNGLEEGSIVDAISVGSGIDMVAGEDPIPGEVLVYGMREDERDFTTPISMLPDADNRAMIFDSNCNNDVTTKTCTGQDPDLATGPGSRVPNFELFEVLIVTEDDDGSDPDDALGGLIRFDFKGFGPDGTDLDDITGEPLMMGTVSIGMVDILDSEEGGFLYCLGLDGEKIVGIGGMTDFPIPDKTSGGGDGLLNIVAMDVVGCAELVVDFNGSGAVDLSELCVPVELEVGGDPVIVGPGGRKTHFWMPLGTFQPVFSTPEGTEVFVRAFGKPGTPSQWIDGVIIKENGVIVADVVMAHDDEEIAENSLLDFTKVHLDGTEKMDSGVHESTSGSTSVRLGKHDFPINGKPGDSIVIATPAFTIELFTMPARKFADKEEADKWAHLDFKIRHVAEPTKCSGFLSDFLFGTQTVDPETKTAWLKKPGPLEEEYLVQTPEVFANETNVVFS